MTRYIDADLFKKNTNPVWYQPDDNSEYCGLYDKKDIDDMIDAQPTADVTEVKHGHWIKHKADTCGWRGCDTVECSVCHAEEGYLLDDNYCPNCGIKMDEEVE